MGNVLIIDDDITFNLMLKTFLEKNNFTVTQSPSGKEALKEIRNKVFDVILVDLRLPDYNGVDLLKKIKEINGNSLILLMTSYADIKTAVSAIKAGAYDYITKPLDPEELLDTLYKRTNSEKRKPKPTSAPGFKYLTGESSVAEKIEEYISLVAPTGMSVLVLGESGTGKEYISKLIHDKSKRKDMPFVAVDCGALSKDLAASELFGHVKGSFTSAVSDKQGQFEAAHKGTLFLDEIGNLSYEIQIKLLRAIQEKKIRKVGGDKDIAVDVRIITATNEDLSDAVKRGEFREDLYHRINEFKIEVFPLRKRGTDIMLFANYFLDEANKELEKSIEGFSEEVQTIFSNYSWPGNLREMRNVIKRAVLLTQNKTIETNVLPEEISGYLNLTHDYDHASGHESNNLKDVHQKVEKEMIINALEQFKYNKSKAAKALNIDRKTLYNKLKLYDIEEY